MPKLTDKEIRKFQKLAKLKDDSDLVLFDEIEEIRNKMEDEIAKFKEMVADVKKDLPSIYEMLRVIQGNKGDTGSQGSKGDKGDKGEKGERGEPGRDGVNGKDGQGIDEEKILNSLELKVPALGASVRDALEVLQGEERLNVSAIDGLDQKLEEIRTSTKRVGGGTGGLQNTVRFHDLSSQLNGVLKEFYVPTHRVAVQLIGTQFPIVYRLTTDYTTARNTLTLTDEVAAPETGQTLTFLYIK